MFTGSGEEETDATGQTVGNVFIDVFNDTY